MNNKGRGRGINNQSADCHSVMNSAAHFPAETVYALHNSRQLSLTQQNR